MAYDRRISTDKDESPVYRILVVDDDPDITLVFKTGLEENGSFLVILSMIHNNFSGVQG